MSLKDNTANQNNNEQELINVKEQQNYFLNIINNVPGAVLRFELFKNGKHRFVYLSEHSDRLWGVGTSDALNDSEELWRQVIQEDKGPFMSSLVQSAKNQKQWNHEWRVNTKNGTLKWLKGRGTPTKLEHSTIWDTLILDITEQKNKEHELAHKTALLERTEKLAKIGSWEYDLESRKVFWSSQIFKIFGLSSLQATPTVEVQKNLITEKSFRKLIKTASDAVNKKKAFTTEIIIKKGEHIKGYCLINGSVKLDANGNIVKLIGSLQDITDRKVIENQLEESQKMFKNIADNVPGVVIRYIDYKEAGEQMIFLSKGINTLFEIDAKETVRLDDLRKFIHPEDQDLYYSSMAKSTKEFRLWDEEFRLKMPDGRVKWIHGMGKPQAVDGNGLLWDIMLLEITKEKQATDSIRSLKEQLDLAIQTANLGVWKVDFLKKDIFWNNEVLNIYGLTREAFNKDKNNWKNFVHPDDFPKVKNAAKEAGSGKNAVRVDFRVNQPSGDTRYVTASASPLYEHKEITGIIGINLDITEFKKIESDLLQAKEQAEKNEQTVILKNEALEKANQELDNFVYRVSHDLRSPITSAIGLSQISLASNKLEEVHEYDKLRIKTLEKLDSFIKEILNYSRNSRLPIVPETIDFKEVIERILLEHQGTIQQANIQIKTEIKENYEFRGDRMRINTILDNLLSNAVKFTNTFVESPNITISITANEEKSFIKVSDNGIGIKKERQNKIYEMFYRGTDKKTGSGIGLYILKECLTKINGSIQLESEEGVGSSFTIEIPSVKAQKKPLFK